MCGLIDAYDSTDTRKTNFLSGQREDAIKNAENIKIKMKNKPKIIK
ncbi:hypothetical protein BPUTEOMOX_2701 [methanotrophic endosymbiont of Bathymodiolus puteoserpentis (Logatchev)]|jgi:hypothetical protein|nr:hypothetical protein BPUTEOMOX_2701 [methanotrophic endosymbiont of Bathymodiolus puteoserpentis (Logatchev)]